MIYYTCAIISVAIVFLHIDAVFTEKQSCFDSYSMYNGVSYNVTSSSPKSGSQVLVRNLCNSTGIITNLIVYLTDPNGKSKNESENEAENENKNDSENDDEGEDDDDNEDDVEDDVEGKDKKRETDTFKFPIIQVWRNFNTSYYDNTYSYPLCADDINNDGELANVSITNKTIAFQAGDFIGYYIPTDSAYSIRNVLTTENISYSIVTDKPLLYFNTNNDGVTRSNMLPKIQILVESFESSTASSAIKSTVPLTASKSSTTARIASTSTTTAIDAIPTEASTIVAAPATTTAFVSTVSTTVAAIATVTIANASTIPVKPSSDGEIGSKSSSTSVNGIVIGCVVGLVICIILIILIIILIWYKKKRVVADEGVCSTAHFNNSQPKCSTDDKGFSDRQYSSLNYAAVLNAGNGCLATIKNTSTYDVINAHIHINHGTDDDDSKTQIRGIEPVPYSDPIDSTNAVKQSSKHKSSDDYESLPSLKNLVHNYEIIEAPYQMLQDPKEIPMPLYGNTLRGNAVSDKISTNEQIYEDPGHKKGVIYSWFEKKKFRRVKKEDIRLLHQIGSGEFGVVHLALWSNGSTDPVQVAVKTLNSQCSESDRVKFLREAAIMGQFVHNNVVQLHGVVTEEENVMILLEYMPKGDLEEILINLGATISQETCCDVKCKLLMFGSQVAAGMNYLANKQFVHRDLAARNILVSSDDVCKIADFGMARDVANDTYYITTGGKIPLKWTAPEAIYYKKYSTQSDVWSFGCVLYEIWSLGHKPFEDIEGTEYVEKITTGYRLPPPPGCPRAIYELMIQCWHPVARHRPMPNSVSQTLQKSNNSLLSSPVTDDAEQSMMLGEPLSAGNQLYLDLQQTYLTNIAN